MEKRYLQLIDEYREEMIKMLQELIAIKSVADDPVENAPFGRGVQDAFEYMLKKAADEGFDTENIDNYGGTLNLVDIP